MTDIDVTVADTRHLPYAAEICEMMAEAARVRGTGIAQRQPEYLRQKIQEGKAVIALHEGRAVGFCYIESWEGQQFVANSGLIVHPDYRKLGLAKRIKQEIFHLSRRKYPKAKLFGITTSRAVMKINSELGYEPVTFSELTRDDAFWSGCRSCVNYDILTRTNRKMCLCTGMVCDPNRQPPLVEAPRTAWQRFLDFIKARRRRIAALTSKKVAERE